MYFKPFQLPLLKECIFHTQNVLADVPDITEKLDTLNSTTVALSHVCDIQDLSHKASAITKQAHETEAVAEERKTVLEEATQKWEDHSREVKELAATVSQAKAAMFAPELETRGLHQQMKAQEVGRKLMLVS